MNKRFLNMVMFVTLNNWEGFNMYAIMYDITEINSKDKPNRYFQLHVKQIDSLEQEVLEAHQAIKDNPNITGLCVGWRKCPPKNGSISEYLSYLKENYDQDGEDIIIDFEKSDNVTHINTQSEEEKAITRLREKYGEIIFLNGEREKAERLMICERFKRF
ncbi:hypothetical protein JW851_04790 [Candidatus Woesearchaeota archaeon]|nr:hypothetical protein [Candidatus Woesearchaeota archaeon]